MRGWLIVNGFLNAEKYRELYLSPATYGAEIHPINIEHFESTMLSYISGNTSISEEIATVT